MSNLHHRVEKQIFSAGGYTDGTGGGFSDLTQIGRERYQYDGWNLVVRFAVDIYGSSEDNIPRQIYTWGPDVASRSTNASRIQAAGGVGGLLWITDYTTNATGATHLPAYDGNGNVVALMNSAASGPGAGQWSALYEYDACGKPLRASGPMAAVNPFRFSTKFTDDESGLVYYGYRYQDTQLGQWVSRDPMGEEGGRNLRGFISNRVTLSYDILGLMEYPPNDARSAQSEPCPPCKENPKRVGLHMDNGKNPNESRMFQSMADHKGAWSGKVKTGEAAVSHLKRVQEENPCNCVSTLTIAGHGWTAEAKRKGQNVGIPGGTGKNDGIYADAHSFTDDASFSQIGGATIWCKKCLIQIYGCRTSDATLSALRSATGCNVVGISGNGSTGKTDQDWVGSNNGDNGSYNGPRMIDENGIHNINNNKHPFPKDPTAGGYRQQ